MFVLMMIIAGMAVALAVYFLLAGVFTVEPTLRAETVYQFGILPSVLVFALCGPVLVLKLWFEDDDKHGQAGTIVGFTLVCAIVIFWSGVLGTAATHSLSAAFTAYVPML